MKASQCSGGEHLVLMDWILYPSKIEGTRGGRETRGRLDGGLQCQHLRLLTLCIAVLGVSISLDHMLCSRIETSHQPPKITASVSKRIPPVDQNKRDRYPSRLTFPMDDKDWCTAPMPIYPIQLD